LVARQAQARVSAGGLSAVSIGSAGASTGRREKREINHDKYDVYDPMEIQLRALDAIRVDDLNLADLASPEVVRLFVHNQRVTLVQLRDSEARGDELRDENVELRRSREELRVDFARLQERVSASWLEIPISMSSGFAINMLADNVGDNDKTGWFLLIVSLVMLLFLRVRDILPAMERLVNQMKGKDIHNA